MWRCGPDRATAISLPGLSTNNPSEVSHTKMKGDVRKIAKAMLGSAEVMARPVLPQFIDYFERALVKDQRTDADNEDSALRRYPTEIDPNLLTGHASITRHSKRLCCKQCPAVRQRRACLGGLCAEHARTSARTTGTLQTTAAEPLAQIDMD